jgi:hypothetical protein
MIDVDSEAFGAGRFPTQDRAKIVDQYRSTQRFISGGKDQL